MAVIGILIVVMTPFAMLITTYRHVHAEFCLYNYADTTWRYKKLAFIVFPSGIWQPQEMRKAFGSLFSGFQSPRLAWTTLPVWSPCLMVIGAAFKPSSDDACRTQFITLAVFQFIIAAVTLIFRPYRAWPSNVGSAASNCCLGTILAASAHLAVNPSSGNAKALTLRAVQAQTAVTAFRLAYRGFSMLLTRFVLQNVGQTQSFKRVGSVPPVKEIKDALVSDDESDLEMGAPLLMGGHLAFRDVNVGAADLEHILQENQKDNEEEAKREKQVEIAAAQSPQQTRDRAPVDLYDLDFGFEDGEPDAEYTVEDELKDEGSLLASIGKDAVDKKFLASKHRKREMLRGSHDEQLLGNSSIGGLTLGSSSMGEPPATPLGLQASYNSSLPAKQQPAAGDVVDFLDDLPTDIL